MPPTHAAHSRHRRPPRVDRGPARTLRPLHREDSSGGAGALSDAPRPSRAHHGDHADDERRGQDRQHDRPDAGAGAHRQTRRGGAARTLARSGLRHEGRRHRRRQGVAAPGRQDQPPFQRRLPRHHVGPQPAGGPARHAPALRQRPPHRSQGDPVAALHGHERPCPAQDRRRHGRTRERAGARNRLHHHRRLRDHGDHGARREPR